MKLEISEAISLILALPAHRSGNEGHRKMGEKAFELLFEYKTLAEKGTEEEAFNRAMISSVLSTIRAFSVERDRISGVWKSIDAIKKRRERYLEVIKNLSPLEKGNYWSKTLSIIIAAGFTLKFPLSEIEWEAGVWNLVIIIIGMEFLSKILEVGLAVFFEKKLPIEKEKKWEQESMAQYKTLVSKFIDEAIDNYKRYYPDERELYGYDITKEEQIEKLKKYLIDLHLYF